MMNSENSPEKPAPRSFIERLLCRIGDELTGQLWENYRTTIEIRDHLKGAPEVASGTSREQRNSKERLLRQTKKIERLRERFLWILSYADTDEAERTSKTLGLKASQLSAIGQDYEELIRSALG